MCLFIQSNKNTLTVEVLLIYQGRFNINFQVEILMLNIDCKWH